MCTFLTGITWLFKMASNRRVCVNYADNFCYICGQYTPKQQCRNINQIKSKITYPNCESARKPVTHDETNPPPVPPADMTDTSSSEESTSDTERGEGETYVPDAENSLHLRVY